MALPKLSKEVYELETDDVRIEYCLDIPDMAKPWFEKHPEWPIIGAWVVDQGASLMQNIGLYKWGSHVARRKVIDSCIQGDNKESTMYSMMKMGPKMRAMRCSTYQKLLDIDSDMPTKPAYYELLYNHMHDPRPQTWYPTFKKLSEVRKRVLAKHDGGVIGDYLCQYGPLAMHLMTIIYYPSPSVRMELAEEMMMDPICHEMTHLIKNIECKGMLPVPGLECRFK